MPGDSSSFGSPQGDADVAVITQLAREFRDWPDEGVPDRTWPRLEDAADVLELYAERRAQHEDRLRRLERVQPIAGELLRSVPDAPRARGWLTALADALADVEAASVEPDAERR